MSRGWPVYREPDWNIWDMLDTMLMEIKTSKRARMKHPRAKKESSREDRASMRSNVIKAFRRRCYKRPD